MPDYFSRKDIIEVFGIYFFSGPVVDYCSRTHISELFGNGFLLDQC